MFQNPEAFYIRKADYWFRRDLWLLFEAQLTRTCSPLTPSCRHLWVVFCFFFVATGRHIWYGLCWTLWLQPRGRLSSHHGLLSLSTRMVRYQRDCHEGQWGFQLWWNLVLPFSFVDRGGVCGVGRKKVPVLWLLCPFCDSQAWKLCWAWDPQKTGNRRGNLKTLAPTQCHFLWKWWISVNTQACAGSFVR